MKITVLNENMVYRKNIIAEHGLSVLIEHDNKKILMDVGQSDVFLKNAQALNIDLNDLDAVIISHGHYDHGGGIKYLKNLSNIPSIYITKNALIPKYSINKKTNKYYFNGINESDLNLFNDKLYFTDEKEEIFNNFYLISNIPYVNSFENKPSKFYLKKNDKMIMDTMRDEQVFVISTKNGLCVFMGCAHMGVVNAIEYIKKLFKGEKIYSLFAGMHLINADSLRVNKTIEYIKNNNIQYIMPCHCSGYRVVSKIADECEKNFIEVQCGKIIQL
ncbi:MBL fold metallo-hydrolase [Anaerofustis sp. LCP19S3_F7]|uniref:MBL fold metallo-hydrolase n=1 Tax=Anaerofustis sp. LCP19S3_F7 TaxID=3440247 RepID=UPI003F8F803F